MKFKYFILGSLFSVVLFILVNVLLVINRNDVINVKDVSGYGRIVTDFFDDIENIKDDNCKVTLEDMLNFVNKTHYDENVTVKEYYENYYGDKTFIDYFYSVQDKCNLENIDSIYVLALSSTNFPEEIKSRYNLRHEFILQDKISRLELIREQDEVGTYTTKVLELRVVQELIEEAKS